MVNEQSGRHREHEAMALVRREREPDDVGHGRHSAAVVDMVTKRVPGTHMHPALRREGGTEA